MNLSDWLFWNVDTQYDFVSPRGKLYVRDAELLKPVWAKLGNLAKDKSIRMIQTADFHNSDSAELDSNPDYITTFPLHCMAGTRGAEFVEESKPENPIIIDWDKKYNNIADIVIGNQNRSIVIRKDVFDVFKGNSNTELILDFLKPKVVVVYGVTTNVCVNDVVLGLSERVDTVFVIEDAIKELPNIPLPFDNWNKLGVEMIQMKELEKLLREC